MAGLSLHPRSDLREVAAAAEFFHFIFIAATLGFHLSIGPACQSPQKTLETGEPS